MISCPAGHTNFPGNAKERKLGADLLAYLHILRHRRTRLRRRGKNSLMKLSEFNFDLPQERIAQRPLAERESSRMLLLDRSTGAWEDRQFREFPGLLHGDELIVVNNARVIPARLFGRRAGLRCGKAGPQ